MVLKYLRTCIKGLFYTSNGETYYNSPIEAEVQYFLEDANGDVTKAEFDILANLLKKNGIDCADEDFPSPHKFRLITIASGKYSDSIKEFCDNLIDTENALLESREAVKKEEQ